MNAKDQAVFQITRCISAACEKLTPKDYDEVLSEVADHLDACRAALFDDLKRKEKGE